MSWSDFLFGVWRNAASRFQSTNIVNFQCHVAMFDFAEESLEFFLLSMTKLGGVVLN